MTRLRMSLTASLVFLLFISGVVAQDGWSVNYNSKSFCTLKRTAVSVECNYAYPSGQSVQKAFWTKELVDSGSEPPDLLDDPQYRGRFQYLGDKHSDCSFRLRDVTEKDQRKYYFTFITDRPGGKYYSADGVDLSVTDLQVEVPKRVTVGDTVTLACKTSCSLTVRPTFTWYRDGQKLNSSTDQLHLQPFSREDVGRYRCAVLGLNSPEVTVDVDRTNNTGLIAGIVGVIIAAGITIIGGLVWKKKQGDKNAKPGSQPSNTEPFRPESEKLQSGEL